MELPLNVKINTKSNYHFELKDIRTGKIKQVVDCHNVITNRFVNRKFAGRELYYLRVGTGQGTPQASDTALFHQVWSIQLTRKTMQNVSATKAIGTVTTVIPASDAYVATVTEVGLGDTDNYLHTHAMLADAEGQPISINKTNTDELTVVITIEFTESISLSGVQIKYPDYIKYNTDNPLTFAQRLMRALLYGTIAVDRGGFTGLTMYFAPYIAPLHGAFDDNHPDLVANYGSQDSSSRGSFTYTTSNGTMTISGNVRVTADSGLSGFYRYMGLAFRATDTYLKATTGYFDLKEIWGPQLIEDLPVGTGNGTTVDFALPLGKIVPTTETIYVNGTAITRDVDYTIDYNANPSKYQELSISYDASTITGVNRWESLSGMGITPRKRLNTGIFDEVWGALLDLSKHATVFDITYPLVLTFNEAHAANHFLASMYCYHVQGSISLEYSDDGTSWNSAFTHSVNTSATLQVDMEHTWEEVSAKYWRLSMVSSRTDAYAYVYTGQNTSGQGLNDYPFYFGHYNQYGIHFNAPPAEGAVITMDGQIDIPYKSSNYAFNVAMNATITI